jgi:inosine-uridine nucleoside N-ribohydrolase
VIIDCDTGTDDALATLLALRSPALRVLGITTVGGNVPLDKVVRNTLTVVEHSGKQVPVLRGAARPLLRPLQSAEHIHGTDGLGGTSFPDPLGSVGDRHAVDFLVETCVNAAQPIHLVTLGPLTNIALALLKEPQLEIRISSLVMMAGAIAGGNVTPTAEFNVYVDPEAADIVFRSRIPKTMVAWDPIIEGATLEAEHVERIEACGTPWCRMAGRLLRARLERWEGPVSPPDPAAMSVAIDASIAQAEMLHVTIETKGERTRGMTVVDRRLWRGDLPGQCEPNVNVVTRFDTAAYRRLFLDTLLRD